MSNLTVQDVSLERILAGERTFLNSGAELRLFTNPVAIGHGHVLGDFVEATYQGYAPVSLVDQFAAPVKDQAGAWSISTPFYEFGIVLDEGEGEGEGESGPTTEEIRGAIVVKEGAVLYAGLLPGPLTLRLPGPPLVCGVEVQCFDAGVHALLLV